MVSMLDSQLINAQTSQNNSHIYIVTTESTLQRPQTKSQLVAFSDKTTLENSATNPYAEFAELAHDRPDKKETMLSEVI